MTLIAKKELLMYFAENGYSALQITEMTGLARPTIHSILKRKRVQPATAKQVCDTFQIKMWDYFDLVE